MNEEDIRSQLKEKNKEIYLNKLNLDLTNNLEVLVISVDNLLNNISLDTKNKVLGIAESFQNESVIKVNINNFIENYRLYLMTLLDTKKNNIESLYKENEDINTYKDKLKELNKEINNNLNNYLNENIDSLINDITSNYNDSFCNLRIKEYLKNIFKDNLNNKVLDIINNRDIILLNTFKESFQKYLELNKNTIGI